MAATSAASQASFQVRTTDGWFYTCVGVFAFLFSSAAFGPSIVYSESRLGPITPLVAAHGIVFFAWLLLFIAQTILARKEISLCIAAWAFGPPFWQRR
jgi:hypothetical protein